MQRGIQLSDRFFRRLIHVYPTEHRRKFGGEMAQVFRDLCLEVYRREGTVGLAKLWAGTLVDLLRTGLEHRVGALPLPSRRETVTIGAWSAIAAGATTLGFALTHASPNWIDWVFRLKWMWPTIGTLCLIGLFGLAADRRSRRQPLDLGLVVALFGAAVMAISGSLMLFLNRVWISFGNGLLILGGGLVLMGLARLWGAQAPRFYPLLLTTGAATVLLWLFAPAQYMGRLFRGDGALSAGLMGLGWIATGLALLRDRGLSAPTSEGEVK